MPGLSNRLLEAWFDSEEGTGDLPGGKEDGTGIRVEGAWDVEGCASNAEGFLVDLRGCSIGT